MDLRQQALEALRIADPVRKAYAVQALWAQVGTPSLPLDPGAVLDEPPDLPGRPARPVLVRGDAVPSRSPFTLEGRAALMHAIAHIEFNAINLALDAVWRFPGLPAAYYLDWLRVAAEEATHHLLVAEHLATLGHAYGDFEAHDGLWTMTWKTRSDFVARMALVPRTLEARGLDATPQIQTKLRKAGDLRAVEILDVILRDEIGHVAIGNQWYRWACAREGLDPVAHYRVLVAQYAAPRLRPPFNRVARLQAGFSDEELAFLEAQPAPPTSAS
ncbi:ferritin-like domain-containing protein [Sphaerotilus sp.]|uniref:ferritin-like domain-containing protein n=1 Tax=Sphaerotilus sp. TaxID=2093942 RepID=UPI002ACD7871|nr:ferritin-like domain-containing protein [Sphaerotilus sp.]MDZ7856563.1 ferritin-like domain-containing protein [Sphaerotilus sp.]